MIGMTRNSLRSAAIALAIAAPVQLASADEMSTILGAGCEGQYCSPAASSGNSFSLSQQGTSNSVSAEQQAIAGTYGNSATLSQDGVGNATGLTQTGGQNATGIAQTGNDNSVTLNQPGGASASVTQTGTYLGLNITQGQNTSIGVTQFGAGSAGSPPVTINDFAEDLSEEGMQTLVQPEASSHSLRHTLSSELASDKLY
jgi:hypothetical protein